MAMKPYNVTNIHELIRHSVATMDTRHQRWRLLEMIYRTGSLEQAEQAAPGQLNEFMPMLNNKVVNFILPHINIILASVVARDPQFIATPYEGGEEAEANSWLADAIIRYYWKRLKVTRELRDASADAIKIGSGFLKVGWTHLEEEGELTERERLVRIEEARETERLTATLESRPEQDFTLLERGISHSTMRVMESEPFVEYVSPYDIFVPSNTRRIDDVRWVAHRLTLPVDEILENSEFDVNEDNIIRDGAVINPADEYQAEWRRNVERGSGAEFSDLALDTATIWEFYDMRTRHLTVTQLNRAEPLWHGEIPWSHKHSPFVHIRNYTSSGHDFWGFGDLENIANIQSMFNEFLTEQIENARRSGQKYLVNADAVTPELIAALESSEPDVVAPVTVPNNEPLSEMLVPVFRSALSGDVYAAKEQLQGYMQEVLGINDFQAGGMGADRMSATAAAVVEGVATLRAQDKIMSIEEGAAQVGNVILRLCQEYLDEPTAIRVSDVQGASWPEVTKSDIFGEFTISIEGGSLKAVNPATREQQALRLMNEVLPIIVELGYDPTPPLRTAMRDLGFNPDEMLVQREQPQQVEGMMGPEGAPAAAGQEFGGPPTAELAQLQGGLAI